MDEQIDYLQHLWDRIAKVGSRIPLPQWHREVLDERRHRYESDPDNVVPWDDALDLLRQKYPDPSR